jgi:hypothetical protein
VGKEKFGRKACPKEKKIILHSSFLLFNLFFFLIVSFNQLLIPLNFFCSNFSFLKKSLEEKVGRKDWKKKLTKRNNWNGKVPS